MNSLESYFDYNGSTPVDEEVASACLAWMSRGFGNAAAAHAEGARARQAIDAAREQVARAIGAKAEEIWFTSGGTESNNWALSGIAERTGRGHIAVSSIEHKSVLAAAQALAERGFSISQIPVGESGAVAVEDVRGALRADSVLVSVMLANNETGILQPVAEIAELCRSRGVAFHCDAVCAFGRVPIDVRALGCDLASLSAHKLYAPKGVGVLCVRRGLSIAPLIHGCGQQQGMRSGSENTSGVVAFGAACERMAQGAFRAREPLDALRDALFAGIRARFPDAVRNGHGPSLSNTLSIAFPGIQAVELQARLAARGFSVAAGAAASNGAASHVLTAMGASEEHARSTLRFSLGRFSSSVALDRLLDAMDDCMQPNFRPEPIR